jgi:DNA repair protein RadC
LKTDGRKENDIMTAKQKLELVDKAANYMRLMESCASYVAIEKPSITCPADLAKLMAPIFATHPSQECCYVVLLDMKNRVVEPPKLITMGTVDQTTVPPRDVVRAALLCDNAARIVVAHNHPSGDSSPSFADIAVTKKIIEACAMFDIELLDHIIMGHGTNFTSMRENGFVSFDKKSS